MREELLYQKEAGPDDFGNAQPLEMAKDIKLRDLLLGKCAPEKRLKVTLQPFPEAPERSNIRVFSHTKSSLKRLRVCLTDPFNYIRGPLGSLRPFSLIHLSRSQN